MRNILKHALLIIVSLSVSIGVVQAAELPSLADVMQEGPRYTGLKMLSLRDAIRYASSTKAFRNDFSLWDDIRQIHLPRLKTNHIQGYGEGNAGSLRMAAIISCYVQRKSSYLIENRRVLIDDVALMGRIHASYTPKLTSALQGYLLMVVGRFTLAFQAFADAGPAMSIEAQEKLHKAVANRNFRFNDATWNAYLAACAAGDKQNTQQQLNIAAGNGHRWVKGLGGSGTDHRLVPWFSHFYNAISGL